MKRRALGGTLAGAVPFRTTTDRVYARLWQSCKELFTWWVNSLLAHSSFTDSRVLGETKQTREERLVLERDGLQVTEDKQRTRQP